MKTGNFRRITAAFLTAAALAACGAKADDAPQGKVWEPAATTSSVKCQTSSGEQLFKLETKEKAPSEATISFDFGGLLKILNDGDLSKVPTAGNCTVIGGPKLQ